MLLADYDPTLYDTGQDTTSTGSNVPAPSTTTPNWLAIGQAIENDIIYGYRSLTQPQVNPNMIGATISGGAAGSQISISPIFLVAVIAIVYFATR